MLVRAAGIASAAILAGCWIGAANVQAATEVGNDCEANVIEVGSTILPLVAPSDPLSISVQSAGIATRWKVRSIPGTDIHTERLKVFRPTPDPLRFQVIAESGLEDTTGGLSSFDIRIPVEAGDRFGVAGKPGEGAIACASRPGDVMGIQSGDPPLGSTPSFSESTTSQVAVTAMIEPDVDHDGYGDETQDGCPESAAYHEACPVITLGATAKAHRKSIVVSVTPSLEAPVTVSGQVKWGFKPKPKGKVHAAAKHKLIVGLTGGTGTVKPGETAAFRVALPKPVLRRLHRLTPKQSLKARLTVSAPNIAGPESLLNLTVKLKGQKKPAPRR